MQKHVDDAQQMAWFAPRGAFTRIADRRRRLVGFMLTYRDADHLPYTTERGYNDARSVAEITCLLRDLRSRCYCATTDLSDMLRCSCKICIPWSQKTGGTIGRGGNKVSEIKGRKSYRLPSHNDYHIFDTFARGNLSGLYDNMTSVVTSVIRDGDT
jgi:hypothetical protein